MMPSRLVRRVRFDEFDPRDFERLVLAFMHRTHAKWRSLEWYGEVGADKGRDIWGVREDGRTVCVQCANWRRLTAKKVTSDLLKILGAGRGAPDVFVVVAGGTVSPRTRDKARSFAKAKGVRECHIWSGVDFEERIRTKAESLLRRFSEGETFPDDPAEVEAFLRRCPLCSPASRERQEQLQALELAQRSDLRSRELRQELNRIRSDFERRNMSGSGGLLSQELRAKRESTARCLAEGLAAAIELARGCCEAHRAEVTRSVQQEIRAACAGTLQSSEGWIRQFHAGHRPPIPFPVAGGSDPHARERASLLVEEKRELARIERAALRDLRIQVLRLATAANPTR